MKTEYVATITPTKKLISIDTATGERQDLGEIELHAKRRERNTGFAMLWTREPKPRDLNIKFLFWLIENMSSHGTIEFITNEQLAKQFGVNEKTIRSLKQRLQEDGFIKYHSETIMINPMFAWRGTANKREDARGKYSEIKVKTKNTKQEES